MFGIFGMRENVNQKNTDILHYVSKDGCYQGLKKQQILQDCWGKGALHWSNTTLMHLL